MSNEQTKKCSKTVQRRLQKSVAFKGLQLSCVSKNGGGMSGWKTKAACLKDDLQCLCQRHSLEYYPALKEILPENYDYSVCSFSQIGDGFKAILRMPLMSPEKAQEWKTCLENASFTIFRVCRTFPGSGRYNIFKMDYACQHNTSRGAGKCATKKTGCKAELSVTVKRVVKKSRSRDKHLPEYPTCIFIRWCHNHSLDAIQSLRYRDVGEDTLKELISLYHRGYTPASAYSFFKSKLMNTWGNKFDTVCKDRRILPEKQYVYRLFAKIKKKKTQQGVLSAATMDPTFDALCRRLEVDVILPAAGSSSRMGGPIPKPFIKVLGSHIIAYTVDCFHRNSEAFTVPEYHMLYGEFWSPRITQYNWVLGVLILRQDPSLAIAGYSYTSESNEQSGVTIPWVRHIVLVASLDQVDYTRSLMQSYGFSKVMVCEGSHARHRSIHCGLQALRNECKDSSVVIIHDGARPFVSEDIIESVAVSAEKHGAAGVVRPLVSTVVKADGKGLLETALKRSDYRNSEMPQGFRYGIIASAYDKCSDEDFDHGTECLLLALKYSRCAAELLEGNDYLWKVTYQKDLPLMETTVKVKFTRLSLIQKSSVPMKCIEPFQFSLLAKGLSIVSSEKEGANTIVCFLNTSSNSTTASVKGEMYAKQFEELYNKLPKSVTKLDLMVIVVFVKVKGNQPKEAATNESQETVSATCSAAASHNPNPSSSSQFSSLPLLPHQHQQSAHHVLQSQDPPPPPSLPQYQHHTHQHPPHHHHHHHDEQQQQPPQYHNHMLSGNLQQPVPLSNVSCPPSLQQPHPFTLGGCRYEYPGHIDSFTQSTSSYSFDTASSQSVVNAQTALSYPPPLNLPSLTLPSTQPISLSHPSQMDRLPGSSAAISTSSSTNCVLPLHQPVNCCQDILLSFSDMQSAHDIYNESHSHHSHSKEDRSVDDEGAEMYDGALQRRREPERPVFSNVHGSTGVNEMEKKPSQDGNLESGEIELMTSRLLLKSMGEKMKKSDMSFCLVGVLCKDDNDMSDTLVDLVWGRNRFLNGQVLSFL